MIVDLDVGWLFFTLMLALVAVALLAASRHDLRRERDSLRMEVERYRWLWEQAKREADSADWWKDV